MAIIDNNKLCMLDRCENVMTVEPFDRAAFSIALNTISDPIRSQEYGYHIVKVTGRREDRVRPFDEVRGEIATALGLQADGRPADTAAAGD